MDISQLSTKDLLKKLRLLTKEGLSNAALVLFGKDPGEFYPNLFVKIGRFGKSVVDMRFQEVCEASEPVGMMLPSKSFERLTQDAIALS